MGTIKGHRCLNTKINGGIGKKEKSTNFVLNETLTTSTTKSYNLILDFKIVELPPRILNKLEIYFLIKMRRPLRDHFFIKRPV